LKSKKIKKVLIANRGEIANRVIRTCQEHGLKTVAVYSDSDRDSPHVHLANESYRLGPAPASESYLNIPRILDALKRSKAQAVHPGYGFLSENPQFAKAVTSADVVFIGPQERPMRLLGDKIAARRLAASLGVPVVPGAGKPISSLREAAAAARAAGYPVLIKAAGGGGGKGMRIVRSQGELGEAISGARADALLAFGDGRLFLEKYIQNPKHIEVQVIGDSRGNTIHLGERECSVQRRHQKIIEESPSTAVDQTLRERLTEAALKLIRRSKYTNAGTVEFIVDRERNFYFLEVNTRLQVEHPVTEMRTGLDIVWEQIRVAEGLPLSVRQDEVEFNGHSIEARVYAEDPSNGYLPSSGTIAGFHAPAGLGVREERGFEAGTEISTFYDPMLSKAISWGKSREQARIRLIRVLENYEIFGVRTNISQCLWVLDHPDFRSGSYGTSFLDKHFRADALKAPDEILHAAIIAAALSEEYSGAWGLNGSAQSSGRGWRSKRLDAMTP
jgi:propionyl-CoA carboxylase alpha chain